MLSGTKVATKLPFSIIDPFLFRNAPTNSVAHSAWSSNGNQVISIWQEDLKIPENKIWSSIEDHQIKGCDFVDFSSKNLISSDREKSKYADSFKCLNDTDGLRSEDNCISNLLY